MNDILSKMCTKGEFASFYTNADTPDKFIFGKVLGVDDDLISLGMFSPQGRFDGVRVFPKSLIFKVEFGDKYGEAMQLLISHNNCIDMLRFRPVPDENQYLSLLKYAENNRKIVSVALKGNDYYSVIGFVSAISNGNEEVSFLQIDEYGFDDGTCVILMDDISELQCESEDESKIESLWKIRSV